MNHNQRYIAKLNGEISVIERDISALKYDIAVSQQTVSGLIYQTSECNEDDYYCNPKDLIDAKVVKETIKIRSTQVQLDYWCARVKRLLKTIEVTEQKESKKSRVNEHAINIQRGIDKRNAHKEQLELQYKKKQLKLNEFIKVIKDNNQTMDKLKHILNDILGAELSEAVMLEAKT